jgi:hypothetical protein
VSGGHVVLCDFELAGGGVWPCLRHCVCARWFLSTSCGKHYAVDTLGSGIMPGRNLQKKPQAGTCRVCRDTLLVCCSWVPQMGRQLNLSMINTSTSQLQ